MGFWPFWADLGPLPMCSSLVIWPSERYVTFDPFVPEMPFLGYTTALTCEFESISTQNRHFWGCPKSPFFDHFWVTFWTPFWTPFWAVLPRFCHLNPGNRGSKKGSFWGSFWGHFWPFYPCLGGIYWVCWPTHDTFWPENHKNHKNGISVILLFLCHFRNDHFWSLFWSLFGSLLWPLLGRFTPFLPPKSVFRGPKKWSFLMPFLSHFLTHFRVSKKWSFWLKMGFLTQMAHMLMRGHL